MYAGVASTKAGMAKSEREWMYSSAPAAKENVVFPQKISGQQRSQCGKESSPALSYFQLCEKSEFFKPPPKLKLCAGFSVTAPEPDLLQYCFRFFFSKQHERDVSLPVNNPISSISS
jgi:hypothetical protein